MMILAVGESLREAMNRTNKKLSDVAQSVNYSKQSVSAWTTNTRKIPKEVMPVLSRHFDDPDFYLEIAISSTGGASLPVLDGDFVQNSPLYMLNLMQKETHEAMEKMEIGVVMKPRDYTTKFDLQEIMDMIEEHLEAATAIVNEVSALCRYYGLSPMEVYQRLHRTLKSRRLRK